MNDQSVSAEQTPDGVARRSLISQFGATAATVMAVGAAATGGVALSSTPAAAQGITDADILNFALNLEYVEAEYYIRGFLGRGLDAADRGGVGGAGGFVLGGSAVPFRTEAIAAYARKITVDEVNHVRFLRRALGSAAVAAPNIDLLNSFNALAAAAGLVPAGTQFNPFADEVSFLLGAFIFEDVGVTAYAGAARLLTNRDFLDAAASILAIEAYHSGTVRTVLAQLGQQNAADAITRVRAAAGGGKEEGIVTGNLRFNTSPSDSDSLAFRRTTTEVLNIVYNGRSTGGGFLPDRATGTIR
ncbi:MAG: ferritin-like domain-containing protein [Gemmatimonadaceae bacterium]|nr:ferritin-like domain-containing protein [Acetobacteraceae bacterium]